MGGPDVQHRGGQSIFLHTLMDIFFFFAGATAPPRDNVAPPLSMLFMRNESRKLNASWENEICSNPPNTI